MNDISSKKTKNKIDKARILFIISVILFITSILSKIYNTSMLLKENRNNENKEILDNTNRKILKKEIKKHIEKINYILDISNTLGEALNYIKINYKDNKNLQVKIVLKDSIKGLNSISKALEIMSSDLDNENLRLETSKLVVVLNDLTYAIDEDNIEVAENIINSIVIDEYSNWKSSIEEEFE